MDQVVDFVPLLVIMATSAIMALYFATASRARDKEREASRRRRVGDIESTSEALRKVYVASVDAGAGKMEGQVDAAASVTRAKELLAQLRSSPRNPAEFVTFWESTYKRLEDYHEDAGRQLRSSYRLAQIAAAGAFIVLVVMGVLAAQADDAAQAAAPAVIATLGAALAAYIGKTFNNTYTQTLVRSMAFFHEPLVMARMLAAERLLDEYGPENEAERAKALTVMISAAVAFDVGRLPHVEPSPGDDAESP